VDVVRVVTVWRDEEERQHREADSPGEGGGGLQPGEQRRGVGGLVLLGFRAPPENRQRDTRRGGKHHDEPDDPPRRGGEREERRRTESHGGERKPPRAPPAQRARDRERPQRTRFAVFPPAKGERGRREQREAAGNRRRDGAEPGDEADVIDGRPRREGEDDEVQAPVGRPGQRARRELTGRRGAHARHYRSAPRTSC
jgi:hypothetical protein